jgi:hypothetical protein
MPPLHAEIPPLYAEMPPLHQALRHDEEDESEQTDYGSDASNPEEAPVNIGGEDVEAAKAVIANHPVKKMERRKGWKPEQVWVAALRNENSVEVSNFLIRLFNFLYCFDRVHGIFKNCTCLSNLDRA